MIYAIGCDIVEISRIQKALQDEKFIKKCYRDSEITYFKTRKNYAQSAAAAFAAKEAVSKALGTGIRGFSFTDIEVLHDSLNKPYVVLHKNAKKIQDEKNLIINITLSHSDEFAVAFATCEHGCEIKE